MRGQWLSLGDVADELGYSERWVLDLVTEGKLRAQVIVANERRSYRVARSDLDAFLAKHRSWSVGGHEHRSVAGSGANDAYASTHDETVWYDWASPRKASSVPPGR